MAGWQWLFLLEGLPTVAIGIAVLRALQAAELIGACALLCHAIDDEARAFYMKHGFAQSPLQPLTMMLGLARRTSSPT